MDWNEFMSNCDLYEQDMNKWIPTWQSHFCKRKDRHGKERKKNYYIRCTPQGCPKKNSREKE